MSETLVPSVAIGESFAISAAVCRAAALHACACALHARVHDVCYVRKVKGAHACVRACACVHVRTCAHAHMRELREKREL